MSWHSLIGFSLTIWRQKFNLLAILNVMNQFINVLFVFSSHLSVQKNVLLRIPFKSAARDALSVL